MAALELQRKEGVVYILDALGASGFSDEKIESFLRVRKDLIELVESQAEEIENSVSGESWHLNKPSTYTFGDSIIICYEFSENNKHAQILSTAIIMQNLLCQSMSRGIMFRGAFAIGSYIEESDSNTVMGSAVADAASWYERADWMGVVSTPKANITIELQVEEKHLKPDVLWKYPVPLKSSKSFELYTIPWPSALIGKVEGTDATRVLAAALHSYSVPLGTEMKFKNTIEYYKNFLGLPEV